ncbi:MAG: cation-translocating P-type ATPase [Kofleriaceae bacterium]
MPRRGEREEPFTLLVRDGGGAVAGALVHRGRWSNRFRFEIPSLVGDEVLALRIEREVAQRPGVVRVVASPRSGRVLVELAPGAPALTQIEHVSRLLRRPRRGARRVPSAPGAHASDARVVLEALGSADHAGLTSREARARLSAIGPNLLEDTRPPSRVQLVVGALANLPTALLLGSAAISLLLGDLLDAGAIVAVIALDAAISYRMERQSAELLASWRIAEVGLADVIRDGRLHKVRASELVRGDLLVVRAGNVIPADARIIEAHRLTVDEAPLTGECEATAKSADPVVLAAPLPERSSMLYRGTAVSSGHGRAVVTATGAETELATVQRLAAASRGPKARLPQRLGALSTRLVWGALGASGVSALASLGWRRPPVEVLRDTVALGVAAIPEGLPLTATAALVRAMARMRERGIVVRRLGTAETLGAVTVACADKTGTLTENRMRMEVISIDGHRIDATSLRRDQPPAGPVGALLAAGVLNSDIQVHENGGAVELLGSSTERALVHGAEDAGLEPRALLRRYPRQRLHERTEDTHYVISEHLDPSGNRISFVKGAPEQVVELCALGPAGAAVLDENRRLASEGLRVLAVGWRFDDQPWRLLGLTGLRDPLRRGSADAVQSAARAGIRTVLLTGDQRATAAAIARQVGLSGAVIESGELDGLLAAPDAAARLRDIAAVARVSPSDKVAVVEALRAAGEVVAMAGDGINDAPALKAADVGIAVGARSTDLARQTADLVLEQADLRSILQAVAEGRIVQDHLRRSIRFQIAGNLGELLLVVGGAIAGRRLISPLGVLWINLLTDTLPGVALALEPGDPGVLDRRPAPPGAPILDRSDWRGVLRDGALIGGASGVAALVADPMTAFAVVGATQFGYAAMCRDPDRGGPDLPFAAMVGGSAALHLLAITSAPLRSLLGLRGVPSFALRGFGLAMATPLFLAWRAHARREIVRRGTAARPTRKDPTR